MATALDEGHSWVVRLTADVLWEGKYHWNELQRNKPTSTQSLGSPGLVLESVSKPSFLS